MSHEVVKPVSHDDPVSHEDSVVDMSNTDGPQTAPDIEQTVAGLHRFLEQDQAREAERVLRRMRARAQRWHEKQPE